jgi:hypothetical protein
MRTAAGVTLVQALRTTAARGGRAAHWVGRYSLCLVDREYGLPVTSRQLNFLALPFSGPSLPARPLVRERPGPRSRPGSRSRSAVVGFAAASRCSRVRLVTAVSVRAGAMGAPPRPQEKLDRPALATAAVGLGVFARGQGCGGGLIVVGEATAVTVPPTFLGAFAWLRWRDVARLTASTPTHRDWERHRVPFLSFVRSTVQRARICEGYGRVSSARERARAYGRMSVAGLAGERRLPQLLEDLAHDAARSMPSPWRDPRRSAAGAAGRGARPGPRPASRAPARIWASTISEPASGCRCGRRASRPR